VRRLVSVMALFLVGGLVLPAQVAAAGGTTTTYATVGCWLGMGDDVSWRNTGLDGQVAHIRAVLMYEMWVYDAAGWRAVGTEVDTVMDESNSAAGVELFRGSFVITSTLGDFAGTFVWHDRPSTGWGHGVGRATDGSGLLWRTTPGVVDPAATGVPGCAMDREIHNLTRLELIAP
jgi:hypothetical protein